MASIVGISVGVGVLLCLLAGSMCCRKRPAASESPSRSDVSGKIPSKIPGGRDQSFVQASLYTRSSDQTETACCQVAVKPASIPRMD